MLQRPGFSGGVLRKKNRSLNNDQHVNLRVLATFEVPYTIDRNLGPQCW